VTKKQLDDLIEFLSDQKRGESRLFFVRAVVRVGGDRGYAVLESLREDQVVGQAASARLDRRRK
jgi:hypothetical protein